MLQTLVQPETSPTPRPEALRDLVRIARWWADHQPDALLYAFSEHGDGEGDRLTYGGFDRAARQLAGLLQARDLADQRAILLFTPGLEFAIAFMGCLYAGVVPVPAYPPEPHRLAHTLGRLHSIIHDAQATAVVTSASIQSFARDLMAGTEDASTRALDALAWVAVEARGAYDPDAWTMPRISDETLAFLQYTSGSTSAPKGVMIRHGQLFANMEMFRVAYDHNPRDVFVWWLPLYHDMGLIGQLLSTLSAGAQGHFMPPSTFLKKPLAWLECITRVGGTNAAAPNFAYDLCVRKISEAERDTLDLSTIRHFVNGAEPVRHDTVARFSRYFAPAGLAPNALAPAYGLAELVVFATASDPARRPFLRAVDRAQLAQHRVCDAQPGADAVTLVSSGRPALDGCVAIVDPDLRVPVPPDRVGEVWIQGSHVAAGYWRQPELTARTFDARLADASGEGPFLRTGDLGFIHDGELFITGRCKDLLIIRGRNLYPQDIEHTMVQARDLVPELRPGCAAATSVELDGDERLLVFQEVDALRSPDFDPQRALSLLRQAIVRDHDVQPHALFLLAPGSLPKTSSGKIMRRACRHAFEADFSCGNLEVIARDDRADLASPAQPAPSPDAEASADPLALAHLEGWIVDWFAREHHVNPLTVAREMGLASMGELSFAALEVDSLAAVELVSALEAHVDLSIEIETLWELETIDALARHLLSLKSR